jgi:hypothetical protein
VEYKKEILAEAKTKISVSKQDQFDHENKTWERSLEFYKQENSYLKTRLSVVIDSKDDKELIKLGEYFQNQFLLKDEFINGLKVDINKQTADIRDNKNGSIANDVINRQEKLRKQISYFETDFSRLKNEFNQVITQFL